MTKLISMLCRGQMNLRNSFYIAVATDVGLESFLNALL